MKSSLSRRELLKLSTLMPLSYVFGKPTQTNADPNAPNILFFIFDTFSAQHASLYGYPRNTTPNLFRFAERSTVYHRNYAGGNFTTPGTASLLTGTYPWTHRATHLGDRALPDFNTQNLFSYFDDYYRIAYTHNPFANVFLQQFNDDIDEWKPITDLTIGGDAWLNDLFPHDFNVASISRDLILKGDGNNIMTNSLTLPNWYRPHLEENIVESRKPYGHLFPRRLPEITKDVYFTLEDAFAWLEETVRSLPEPYIIYFHLFPPHEPYRPRQDMFQKFIDDGFQSPEKPDHQFTRDKSPSILNQDRRLYDEFILYVDAVFGDFYDFMEQTRRLDNSWMIFGSDHGEMFERGIDGHITPTLFDPVIRTPLIVHQPGQKQRVDVHTPTSNVDILPTLLQATGRELPPLIEGQPLPPLGSETDRAIFAVEAGDTRMGQHITRSTTMNVRHGYKLSYYQNYSKLQGEPLIELYDINADPDELDNLASRAPDVAKELIEEIQDNWADKNKAYRQTETD